MYVGVERRQKLSAELYWLKRVTLIDAAVTIKFAPCKLSREESILFKTFTHSSVQRSAPGENRNLCATFCLILSMMKIQSMDWQVLNELIKFIHDWSTTTLIFKKNAKIFRVHRNDKSSFKFFVQYFFLLASIKRCEFLKRKEIKVAENELTELEFNSAFPSPQSHHIPSSSLHF